MNNKPITIIALIILGLCLLGKFSMKGNKNVDMGCNIILFIAIVLLAVNQLLNEVHKEKFTYTDQSPCTEDKDCDTAATAMLCLNDYPGTKYKYCVKGENAETGIAGSYIQWWDYTDRDRNETDPRNNYTYKCSSSGDIFQAHDARTFSSGQKSIAFQNWPGIPASGYACVQGCTDGSCEQQGTDFENDFTTYRKLKGGDGCIYDGQCRSGTCEGSIPIFSKVGECSGDTGRPTGTGCFYDTDCESGACGFNTSISGGDALVCCSGKNAILGISGLWCTQDIDVGGECTHDLECKSDACGFNTSISGGNKLVCCSGKNGTHFPDERDWCENDIDVNGECTYNLECKNNACGLKSDYSKYICCPSGKTHVGGTPPVVGQDICGP